MSISMGAVHPPEMGESTGVSVSCQDHVPGLMCAFSQLPGANRIGQLVLTDA